MVNVDSLISRMASNLKDVSKEEILKRLEEKRRKTGGLISDEVLLRTVFAELGIEVSSNKIEEPTLLIGNLVPGLSDVTVTGRVVAVFPPKTSRRDRGIGSASLLVVDKSGTLHVVLWNDKVAYAEQNKLRAGQIVRIRHGHTREGRLGNIELHVGEKGEFEIEPKDLQHENFPKITDLTTKIGTLTDTHKNTRINIIGKVQKIFKTSTFARQDSTTGKVMRLVMADETDEIPIVIWNEKIDETEKFVKEGIEIYIANAKVKKAVGGDLELHVDSKSYLDIFTPEPEFLKIAELKIGLKGVCIKGEVATKPLMREVKTSKGETAKLTVFEIKDETGKIWISAWRKNAEKASNLKIGEKITIRNADVKKGFGDQLEISTRSVTSIETTS